MAKYTKFLYLKTALILLVLMLLPFGLTAAESLSFKSDYFLYSDDLSYLYGGGNISLDTGKWQVTGDVLYMNVQQLSGVIYGKVTMQPTDKSAGTDIKKYDAVYFKGVFPNWQWLGVNYEKQLQFSGDETLQEAFAGFSKKTIAQLKSGSLFFEFKEFSIDKNQKIRAKYVIPYMMGLPTVPLRSFTVKRGQWAEKTMLAFNNINYTASDGLSLSFFLRLREKFTRGDYDIKLYERKLFNLADPKRGVLFSGQSRFFVKSNELLNYNVLVNSGDRSLNLRLNHRQNFKFFSYSLSQNISGRKNQPLFTEFSSRVTLNRLKLIQPAFLFSYDFKKSISYGLTTPLNLLKRVRLNVGWKRKIIRDTYRSDTSDFTTSMNFNGSFFSLNSNYNYSRNLLAAAVRKNFSVNMRMKPIYFLLDNIALDFSSFYMFSELPSGNQTLTRISPGVNIAVRSEGALLPLGFKLVPSFSLNHLWDNREENFTDFGYGLALRKELGKFAASLDYTLASRYRADSFWIEGNNRQNLNFNLSLKDRSHYSVLLRFYWNTHMKMENISLTGQINLPYDLRFSSFLLYYNQERKFRTLEIFIEKTFKKKIKIQGGYSLALKRFFIKFITT